MQLCIRTSSSNSGMIPIRDFRYLYELAKCSKCQMFILKDNILYGASDEAAAIHEIPVPYQTNTDLMFRVDTIPKDIFDQHDTFFIPEQFSWVILPAYYWDMYIAGDLECLYNPEINQYMILDKTTKIPIQQIFVDKVRAIDDFGRKKMIAQLDGYLNRIRTLLPRYEFKDVHLNPVVQYIFDSKAIAGESLVYLDDGNKKVAFYLFKGMFALSKSDVLNLDVRFDAFDSNLFVASFKPIKKKNPMSLKTYGVPFSEQIHCMYINLANPS